MNDAGQHPKPEQTRIIQPCAEACTGFQALPDGRWPDFGLCHNPASPFYGRVVRIGQECAHYRTDPLPKGPGAGGAPLTRASG